MVANEFVVLADSRIRKEEKMALAVDNVLADEKQSNFWLTVDSMLKFPSFPLELGDAAVFIDCSQQQAAGTLFTMKMAPPDGKQEKTFLCLFVLGKRAPISESLELCLPSKWCPQIKSRR